MSRSIVTAHILAVGSELTTGATRDTNSGALGRELSVLGLRVVATAALPDDLERVTDAFARGLAEADLVVSTGGLGPTPDDLTREAIAAACGLEPRVDPATERWLHALFARRKLPMPDANLKQAWVIDGALALANAHGTAPGWWVERPDGGLIVALPGPPREMWPMWRDSVVPRLRERGAGTDRATRTLRLTGIGESALVELIGEDVLRAANPEVATYARADAVDIVVTGLGEPAGRTAEQVVEEAVAALRPRIGRHVFAEDDEGWPEALARVLGPRRLAVTEIGSAGQLLALLGAAPFLQFGQLLGSTAAAGHAAENLALYAERVREMTGADVGLALQAVEGGDDTRVRIAIATPDGTISEERTAFLSGAAGRSRAALAACTVLWQQLGGVEALP